MPSNTNVESSEEAPVCRDASSTTNIAPTSSFVDLSLTSPRSVLECPKNGPHPRNGHKNSAQSAANPDEDWTKISDLANRRRIQNRIAQRNYRERKKIKRRDEELDRRAKPNSPPRGSNGSLPSRPDLTEAQSTPSIPDHIREDMAAHQTCYCPTCHCSRHLIYQPLGYQHSPHTGHFAMTGLGNIEATFEAGSAQ